MWEHLLDDSIDERFKIVSDYLGNKIKGKHVVDVNCGVGHFVNFIDGYASYYGNDIKKEFIEDASKKENVTFEVLDEKKLIEKLRHSPVDIIVYFGAGVGGVEGEETGDILRQLIVLKKPEIFVIEGTWEYEQKYNLMTNYENFLSIFGYKTTFKKRYKGKVPCEHVEWMLNRYVVIMEKI